MLTSNVYNSFFLISPQTKRNFEINLGKIWYGWLGSTEYDVAMAKIFDKHVFPDPCFSMYKNLLYCSKVNVLVSFSFLFFFQFWCFLRFRVIKKSKMADPIQHSRHFEIVR